MQRRLLPLLIFLFMTTLLALGLSTVNRMWTSTAGDPRASGDTLLIIPTGASSGGIARVLVEAGILESPRIFLWGVRVTGSGSELKAGRYLFARPSSPAMIMAKLKAGETEKVWLTLPEGLWLDETVSIIASTLELDSLRLAELVRQPERWPYPYLAGLENLEGFLLPDTYAFEYPADMETVVDHILANCDREISRLGSKKPSDWAFTIVEWITLASIIEAEAGVDDERPRIAAVYLNRLRKSMRLEADPTVMYALGRRRSRLYYKHLKIDSPYNTYRTKGLPPGPICSPGLKSIEAPLLANPDDPYLYFVASSGGRHEFSKTFDEHRRKIREIRGGQRGSAPTSP
ncbi:MAG: endolytic transglycosylase MltG [bacterium]|nr:endolytic transglycosylase MltG [bacterium]